MSTKSKSTPAGKIRILVVRVDHEPEACEIDAQYLAMQKIVGGTFRCFGLTRDIFLYCNDAGLLLRLPVNKAYSQAVRHERLSPAVPPPIVGDFFIARHDPPHTVSLTDTDVAEYAAIFRVRS